MEKHKCSNPTCKSERDTEPGTVDTKYLWIKFGVRWFCSYECLAKTQQGVGETD